MRYRVKVYGHTKSDDEAFVAKLAAVLGLDLSTTRHLLRNAPVVVRQGLEEAEANTSCELLTAIGALCLIEPVEGTDVSPAIPADRSTGPALATVPAATEVDKRLSSFVWPGVVLGAVVLGLFLDVLSIWSSYTRMSQAYRPAPRVLQSDSPGEKHEPPPEEPSKSLGRLYSEMDAVEKNIDHLRFVADMKELEMRAVVGAYRADRNVAREMTIQWEAARAELDAELKQRQELKSAIEKREAAHAP